MVKSYLSSILKMSAGVTIGSVVTIHVDRRVASHPRGVIAVVFDFKESTGGIIACSESGIICNGMSKKVWWIPSDQYKLIGNADDKTALPRGLLTVQQNVKAGTFDPICYGKCTLSVAHQQSVGASSPCKKGTCGCSGGKCSGRCGCIRGKRGCSSTCSCSGNCANPFSIN